MPQVKCPSCEANIELPDDPRIPELKELLVDQKQEITRLREKLEQMGVHQPAPAPAPTPAPEKKKRKRYEGAFFDDDTEEEE